MARASDKVVGVELLILHGFVVEPRGEPPSPLVRRRGRRLDLDASSFLQIFSVIPPF